MTVPGLKAPFPSPGPYIATTPQLNEESRGLKEKKRELQRPHSFLDTEHLKDDYSDTSASV